jgi:hypothetical protein
MWRWRWGGSQKHLVLCNEENNFAPECRVSIETAREWKVYSIHNE